MRTWLEESQEHFLLLTGAPGSGKTAAAVRLFGWPRSLEDSPGELEKWEAATQQEVYPSLTAKPEDLLIGR
ncbi:MAG: hypothetical protein KDE28_01780 [Anaerolineales bacterium]|nr:hypothetical protein [Anaerolineales bacterium]